jgi:hypothetical protein
MGNFTEEQILEPLGGWDNLVLMCEAGEKRKVFENLIEFKVGDFEVRCGKDLDYLFGCTWSLRIRRGDKNLYSTSCITSFSLVRRTFEHYTNFVLEW